MSRFDLYVDGQPDAFDTGETEFEDVTSVRKFLEKKCERYPRWVTIGAVTLFSGKISAIEEAE